MKIVRAVATLALLMLTAAPALRAQMVSAADQTVLDNIAKSYETAWAKGDAKAIAALFAADGKVLGADGNSVSGRAAIEKDLATQFAGPLKGSAIKIVTVGGGWALRPDVAIEHGTYEIHVGKDLAQAGVWMVTDAKGKDGWQLAATSSFVPQAPPPPAKPADTKKAPAKKP